MMIADQLPLPLVWSGGHGADDFYIGACNTTAVAWLEKYPDWQHHATVLTGPPKSGKSHLADVFRTRNSTTVTVVEIASHRLDEAALFHKFNAAKEADHGLLMVAHEPPSLWALRLPDLASRLAATPLVTIGAPDDKVLAAVLIKQLRDRGLLAPPAVIDYLAVRMERSFAAVHTLAQILDAAALASQRALTVKFVGKVLDDLPSQDII